MESEIFPGELPETALMRMEYEERIAELEAINERIDGEKALLEANYLLKLELLVREFEEYKKKTNQMIAELKGIVLTKDVTMSQLAASVERERLATKDAHEQLGLSRKHLVELEYQLVAMQVEKAAQLAAADRMGEEFAKLQRDSRLAHEASDEAAVSLQQAKQEVDRIRREKALLEALIVEFVDYKNETTQTIADLKAKNQNLISAQNEVATMKEEAVEKEQHAVHLLAEIVRLELEVERREERIRNEMLRADDALEKVAYWSKEATEIAAAFEKELAEKTKAFEAKTNELEEELAAARGHTLASLTSLDQASGDVDRLTSEVAVLKQELLSSQTNSDAVTADLRKEVLTAAALRNELDTLTQRSLEDSQIIKKAEDAAAELSRNRDALQTAKEKLLSDAALMRNDLKVLEHIHTHRLYH